MRNGFGQTPAGPETPLWTSGFPQPHLVTTTLLVISSTLESEVATCPIRIVELSPKAQLVQAD